MRRNRKQMALDLVWPAFRYCYLSNYLERYVDFLLAGSDVNSLFIAIFVSINYFTTKGSQGAASRTLLWPLNPLNVKWANVPEPAG